MMNRSSMFVLLASFAAVASGCTVGSLPVPDAEPPPIPTGGNGDGCYTLVPSSFVPIAQADCDPPAGGSDWQPVLSPTAPHVVDGRFTGAEWDHVPPLSGQYTDVYVDVRDGHLYVLNDWHVNAEGRSDDCFNLFALKIGGRRVEIRVFPGRVEIDGMDVTGEGTSGFGPSERYSEPHTMWEFRIPFASTSDVIVCAHDPASYSACLAEPTDPECGAQPALTSEPTVFSIAADGSRVRRSVPPSVPRLGEGAPCGVELGVCDDGFTCEAEGDVRRCRAFDWPTLEEVSRCDDEVLDETEADVDCGGACPGCGIGERCETDLDCASGSCEAGRCAENPFPCGEGECAGGTSYCMRVSETQGECRDTPAGCGSCECLPASVSGCDCVDDDGTAIYVSCSVM